jgi:chemotaxis protein methyltransferase CheR
MMSAIAKSSADATAPFAVAPLTDGEFARCRQLVEREIGIHLSEAKRPLVVSRLMRRLRQLRLSTVAEYLEVVGRDPRERRTMLDAICTNETAFFREPKHFELLRTTIFPRWREAALDGRRPRRIRIWSSACSTGEEPYSLAMLLLDEFGGGDWDLRIDATDVSGRVLDQARRGVWAVHKATPVPEHYLRRFMLRGTHARAGTFQAGHDVRSILRFGYLNLIDETYAMEEYDAVFCRNVLIYFTAATRAAIVQRLIKHIVPGGYFFVGHAETLAGVTEAVRAVIPTVYVR